MVQTIVNKAATQESAALANIGAVNTLAKEIKSAQDKKSADPVSTNIIDDPVSHLKDSQDMNKAGNQLLRSMILKLSGTGILPDTDEIMQRLDSDRTLLNDEPENKEDTYSSSSTFASSPSLKRAVKQNAFNVAMNAQIQDPNSNVPQKAMEQYMATYAAFLTSDDPKTARKLRSLEAELKQNGISEGKIFSMQTQVRSSVRADIALKLKENILIKELSGSKVEDLMTSATLFGTIRIADSNKKLGGKDFGNYNTDLQGTITEASNKNVEELSSFALEVLEQKLIEKTLKQDKNVKDLDDLIKLAGKTGVDLNSWVDKVWKPRKEDLGLNLIDIPAGNFGSFVNTNTDDPGKNKKHQQAKEIDPPDESKILMSRLRALYMQRLIKGDMGTNISTFFKIRKVKNGLIKLGVYTKELDEKISFESEILAKGKTLEMIKEALLERATLYHLKGPALKLIDNRIKSLLKNADRLGISIGKDELESLKYNANKVMLDMAGRQREILEVIVSKTKNVRAEKELAKFRSLEKRLTEEMANPNANVTDEPVEIKSEIA
jgi:hypothetical protein